MLNGHELDRMQLPVPLSIRAGDSYRVRVSVKEDHFICAYKELRSRCHHWT